MIHFEPDGMTNRKLDKIIRRIGTIIQGDLGYWQFRFADLVLMCLTDEHHDRMRVICSIMPANLVSSEELLQCMSANFDRALDARYCLSDGTLWGAYIHPLRSLDEEAFASGCYQVSEVVKTFGESYSSGGLSFNSGLFE